MQKLIHPRFPLIHLVKQLMHRVEYSRKDDRNCLVLMRQLPGQAPDEPGKG